MAIRSLPATKCDPGWRTHWEGGAAAVWDTGSFPSPKNARRGRSQATGGVESDARAAARQLDSGCRWNESGRGIETLDLDQDPAAGATAPSFAGGFPCQGPVIEGAAASTPAE
jgi:hypothetical protein